MPSAGSRKVLFWRLVLFTVVFDRITKIVAESALSDRVSVHLAGDFAQFRLIHNPGAAFGLDLGVYQRWIFLTIAIAAIAFLYAWSQQAAPTDLIRQYAVGFVAGGAAGNAVDRVLSAHGVVDYIDIGIGALRWPTFNVADIAVSLGAVALAFSFWREDEHRAAVPSSSA